MKSAIIGDEDEGKKGCFEYLDAVEKGQGQIVEDKPKPKADEPFVDDDIPF